MKSRSVWVFAGLAVAAGVVAAQEFGQARIELTGYQEVPALSSTGRGSVQLQIHEGALSYVLSYSGLEGTVLQAHIHVAQPGVNGGISVWLCGTATNPGPAGTPTCPQEGTVARTVTASDVVGPAGQGVEPGALAELVAAMRAGVTYANVHSSKWPGGEIRGQLGPGASTNRP